MTETYDIVVIGLGAMGSAALYQLAKRGVNVLGIDRFAPPHTQGSTHGETRITRRGIGEGEAYVPLVMRSHEIWRELEAETGDTLLSEVGSIIISYHDDAVQRPGRTGFIRRSIQAARRYGIDHEILDAAEIRHRFPNFTPQDDEIGYYEPGGGYVSPERCVATQLSIAQKLGAEVRLGRVVTSIDATASGVTVVLDDGSMVCAGQTVVSAGPWAPNLLGAPFDKVLSPTRQVMHWFALAENAPATWNHSPVFMWPHGETQDGFFYGFPSQDGLSVKTADEFYGAASDPNAIDRNVPESDSQRMHAAHLAGRLAGVTPRVTKTATCIYTVTPDSAFLIDRHPEHANILVASPCSGHGFKHSAAIGESLAQWAIDGQPRIDLSVFALSRFL
ncbi:N-methyl-L-tryptophan oxidase [Paradevosia shaoguanensis]|uniref:N-methyl-L-tryptophan oxidase n=1 Tax=Paradevosia shaoguanensis TaxID=1335043 RepID=A0AA41UEM7_9HYPH|nr:N-methyl-L-tryptophan oxidase [Paradevosia shaoguanensis]MCF1741153.1 N-methyl-L-tryptophan oxidase [Paradevosia shaoguanensis]MCI0125636.1 N-methyl-L-tryptophan oxidase [Paradevosia shaoguanensis]